MQLLFHRDRFFLLFLDKQHSSLKTEKQEILLFFTYIYPLSPITQFSKILGQLYVNENAFFSDPGIAKKKSLFRDHRAIINNNVTYIMHMH